MRIKFNNFVFMGAFALATIMFGAASANATLIDFDELVLDPERTSFDEYPLTDEYAAKGLVISGGYAARWYSNPDAISGPNYLLAGIGMTLSFVGDLPTQVSMYVNSWRQETIYFDFFGPSGFLQTVKTKGWEGVEDSPAYEPQQFISFESLAGIDRIVVNGFYGRSTGGEIDDLRFTYSSYLPEPAPWLLLGLGLLIGFVKRFTSKLN